MSVNNKHLATLLLGAAAAFAAHKYSNMTDEEKQKISASIKDKFHKLKDEAEDSVDSAKTYFNDLKNKAGDFFKEHFPNAENHFHDFFKNDASAEQTASTTSTPGTGTSQPTGL